ncbi:arylamine N-acetyltransferase family protein [Sphingopyxis panaciterrulae]|uniref:N-hydroxyarylamine O-acetyltransferase n=1 Tax=Sphingopyxis panaciterrulae TaxID=462372 RepID=A0A7W9ENZ3_9SPHN|nr:arylamine N-acetyltransferase [Sphingopyxis panaciterrulae]MBB5705012.1 N-hydroxyarylamine O-acetyltransferase [Sphingopyxis panaciterrulae]
MLYRPDPDESAAVPPPPDEALLARYFARIGYSGPARPTLAVLEALQAAHIAAIPFESIDALVEGHIDIGAEAVAAKLIDARRGGYCFEQNGLFLRVLRAIGFEAEGLLGRVRWMRPPDAPPAPRSHMVLRVRIDGRPWLSDVGFGSAVPPRPLAMDSEAAQATAHERYRIVRRGSRWSVRIAIEDEWAPLYAIDDEPPAPIDYEVANWYTATHPDSHFRHELIAARTTAAARLALRDNRLTIRRADGTSERRYLTAEGIAETLTELFGLPVRPSWQAAIERAATAEIEG